MKRWTLLAGVLLGSLLVPLALARAGKKEAAEKGRFMQVGKTYFISFSAGASKQRDIECKVTEEPRDGWVRVRLLEEGQPLTSWINLQFATLVMLHPKDE